MPRDQAGNFHVGGLRPVGKEGKLPMAEPKMREKGLREPAEGETQTTITHHADGTHTVQHHDGEETEHLDHLHALTHIGHKIAGGKHHLVHHDGLTMHSHGTDEGGQHDGTHDHDNLQQLHDSMDKFLGEEAQEGGDWGEEKGGYKAPSEGLSGFQG